MSQNQDAYVELLGLTATSCCVWKNKALSGIRMVPQMASSLGPHHLMSFINTPLSGVGVCGKGDNRYHTSTVPTE